MRVSIEMSGYNPRRYGKPWGAVVKFEGAKMSYDFSAGSWLGSESGGNVYIDCEPSDIIASGQKDLRNGKSNTAIYIVQEDGSLLAVDKVGAFEHWGSRQAVPGSPQLSAVSTEDLLAELKRRGIVISA